MSTWIGWGQTGYGQIGRWVDRLDGCASGWIGS